MPLIGAPDAFNAEYRNGTWEADTHSILGRFLTPNSIFVDIGAWVGPVTRWALDLGAGVYAFDPDPIAYRALIKNCPEAVNMQSAVTPHGEPAYIWHPIEGQFGDSMTRITPQGLRVNTVSAQYVANLTPALIKIDIEGYECELLPVLLPLVTCPVWVSWHQDWWPDPQMSSDYLDGWGVSGSAGGFGKALLTRKP